MTMPARARDDRRMLGSIILVGVLVAVAVRADVADNEKVIAQCATHAAKDERIACLERGLRRIAGDVGRSAADPAGLPVPPSEDDPVKAADDARSQAAVPVEVSPPGAAAPAAPPAAVTRADDGEAVGKNELGSEQLARHNETGPDAERPVTATVVAFNVVGYRKLLLELDNGQIWRQTNGDRADVTWDLRDERNFAVELRRSGLGGYRMYIAPIDRTIRVERVR